MPKWIELKPHLTSEELYRRYQECGDPSEKVRWLALHLVSKGIRAAEAARQVGRTPWWFHALARRYNERGPEAVPDARVGAHHINAGRKPRLDEETTRALDQALRSAPAEGGAWTASKVARWIKERTGQSGS
jgi:transposase